MRSLANNLGQQGLVGSAHCRWRKRAEARDLRVTLQEGIKEDYLCWEICKFQYPPLKVFSSQRKYLNTIHVVCVQGLEGGGKIDTVIIQEGMTFTLVCMLMLKTLNSNDKRTELENWKAQTSLLLLHLTHLSCVPISVMSLTLRQWSHVLCLEEVQAVKIKCHSFTKNRNWWVSCQPWTWILWEEEPAKHPRYSAVRTQYWRLLF